MSNWKVISHTEQDGRYRMEVGLNQDGDAWEQVRVFDDLPLPEGDSSEVQIAEYQRACVMEALVSEWDVAMAVEVPAEPDQLPGVGDDL